MLSSPGRASIDRGTRRVARLRLRASDRRERPRAQMLIEEVLRLTTLPAEDQGRVYCIRRLQFPPLDEGGAQPEWTARCATHLLTIANQAVRAIDAGSAHANVVFFADVHEAYRQNVTRLLHGDRAGEWFWPQATGVPIDLATPVRVEQLLERWQLLPPGWAGVARELVPALDPGTASTLLQSIRPRTAARWLGQDGPALTPTGDAAPPIRPQAKRVVHDLQSRFDRGDSRLLLFAALAVLDSSPAIRVDSVLVRMAASVLEAPALVERASLNVAVGGVTVPYAAASPTVAGGQRAVASGNELQPLPTTVGSEQPLGAAPESPVGSSDASHDLEYRTGHAGLYFLLHVLRHLGIAAVLDEQPDLAVSGFVPRVLLRLAADAGVHRDDPILRPLLDDTKELVAAAHDAIVMPLSCTHLRPLHPGSDVAERLWSYAVRRWCWQMVRHRTAAILKRPGRVRATPTSIVVTLPMAAVNVAFRRVGLDIDPGYLPWFGRVVHFHYHVEGSP